MPSAVSFRYARALVDVLTEPGAAKAVGDPRRIAAQLREFDELLRGNQELGILFATPAISATKKRSVLAGIAPAMELDPITHNFLGVLLQHERTGILSEIIEAFDVLLNEKLGVVEAQITSARALGDQEKQELEKALRARTGKQVVMHFSLDPELIAGVLAQVGSTIYDGSVRGQLERLRAELRGQAARA